MSVVEFDGRLFSSELCSLFAWGGSNVCLWWGEILYNWFWKWTLMVEREV
jgi:hypothetical protein